MKKGDLDHLPPWPVPPALNDGHGYQWSYQYLRPEDRVNPVALLSWTVPGQEAAIAVFNMERYHQLREQPGTRRVINDLVTWYRKTKYDREHPAAAEDVPEF